MKQLSLLGPTVSTDKASPIDAEAYLTQLTNTQEPYIFLYGENPHLCFIRTHSSTDKGPICINRKKAEAIMAENSYRFKNYHRTSDGRRAQVYRRK